MVIDMLWNLGWSKWSFSHKFQGIDVKRHSENPEFLEFLAAGMSKPETWRMLNGGFYMTFNPYYK